jgi:hydrogenase expression/formation protein HypE
MSAADRPGRRTESQAYDLAEAFRLRAPRLTDEVVTLAHGAGGTSSAALVEAVFLEAFRNPLLEPLDDAAELTLPSGERVAFSTDSYVVTPIRFPGGSIGDLAVNGTVNDLAVSGAVPQWISAAFVLEEGLSVDVLRGVVGDLRDAAAAAGVLIVTGDTKVVPRGGADGLFITTSGVGLIPAGLRLGAHLVRPGDHVLLSGSMGRHGMAVLLARDDLGLDAAIESDTASVYPLVADLLVAAPDTRWMRDATRGGVATVCNELARAARLGVALDEDRLPVASAVQGACDLLGIDPVYVANEGTFVAVVPAEQADAALDALRSHPNGSAAARIGEIVATPPGVVVMRTPFGGTRIVDMLVGDPMPRIC